MPRKPSLGADNGRAPIEPDDIGHWMTLRDELIAQMTKDGTWQPMFGPMLTEVAEALRMAAKLREAAEEEPFVKSARSGRSYIHPGIAAADIEVRRAALLLQRIVAMSKSRPAQERGDEPEDAHDEIDQLDEETQWHPDPVENARILAQRRANYRAAVSKGRRSQVKATKTGRVKP